MVQANLSEIPQLKFIRVKNSETIDVFDCGDADLNDFILHKASLFDRNLLAVSYAFVDEEDYGKIYAYINAIPFYAKNGFQMLNSDDDEGELTRLMYFDLMDLVG